MSKKTLSIAACVVMMLACCVQLNAQNKDIDKGKETLKKAMEQKDASKKQEMIQKAIESFQKGGMKREMYAREFIGLPPNIKLSKPPLITSYTVLFGSIALCVWST